MCPRTKSPESIEHHGVKDSSCHQEHTASGTPSSRGSTRHTIPFRGRVTSTCSSGAASPDRPSRASSREALEDSATPPCPSLVAGPWTPRGQKQLSCDTLRGTTVTSTGFAQSRPPRGSVAKSIPLVAKTAAAGDAQTVSRRPAAQTAKTTSNPPSPITQSRGCVVGLNSASSSRTPWLSDLANKCKSPTASPRASVRRSSSLDHAPSLHSSMSSRSSRLNNSWSSACDPVTPRALRSPRQHLQLSPRNHASDRLSLKVSLRPQLMTKPRAPDRKSLPSKTEGGLMTSIKHASAMAAFANRANAHGLRHTCHVPSLQTKRNPCLPPHSPALGDEFRAPPVLETPTSPTTGMRRRLSCRRSLGCELPLLHEERSLDCNLHVSFLLPIGVQSEEFMDLVRAPFIGADEGAAPEKSDRDFLLVPYDDNKTALVKLHRVGPVEALEHARKRSHAAAEQKEGLPEPVDKTAAVSTALVYVVHRPASAEGVELQLRPICAAEASYATLPGQRPSRFIAAIHDHQELEPLGAGGPGPLAEPGPLGEEMLRELRLRGAGALPCFAVAKGNRVSHRFFLTHVVQALVASSDSSSVSSKSMCSLATTEADTATPSSSYPSSPHLSTRGSSSCVSLASSWA